MYCEEWFAKHALRVVPAQTMTAKWLSTRKEFDPAAAGQLQPRLGGGKDDAAELRGRTILSKRGRRSRPPATAAQSNGRRGDLTRDHSVATYNDAARFNRATTPDNTRYADAHARLEFAFFGRDVGQDGGVRGNDDLFLAPLVPDRH